MSWIFRKFKGREEEDRVRNTDNSKTENMVRNGAIVLKELIASSHGKYNPYRIFSTQELKQATNNYDQRNVISESWAYKLYSGFWQERLISVMRFYEFNDNDEDRTLAYECCINNIVYAAQMSHNHILNLIGCCLETPFPVLVFESVEHGTLPDRISGAPQPQFEPLLFKHRLKIAKDIAHALAYLHLGFPRPIVIRNFTTSHISFNEENVAKLFDFSLSISIPEGETHITDVMKGTYGYWAPDYARTGVFNEKSDVFGFGVFLFLLLTGWDISDLLKDTNDDLCPYKEDLKNYFEGNRFTEIVAPIIVQDISCIEKEQQLQASAQLTFECLNDSPVDRPIMVDVAKKLRQIYYSCV